MTEQIKQEVKQVLSDFVIYYEAIPKEAMIDFSKKTIILNPLYGERSLLLLFLLLRHLDPETDRTVTEKIAKAILRNDPEFRTYLELYCQINGKMTTSRKNIFSKTGVPGKL